VVGFLPVHFKHGNRREEISNCCWFIFADVIFRFEEIRRTPSLYQLQSKINLQLQGK
jgi:hypothetical protein